jgi:hypothetical protein
VSRYIFLLPNIIAVIARNEEIYGIPKNRDVDSKERYTVSLLILVEQPIVTHLNKEITLSIKGYSCT